jgi:hypothetical protein
LTGSKVSKNTTIKGLSAVLLDFDTRFKKSMNFSEIQQKSMGSVRSEIRNRRFLVQILFFLKIPKKNSTKICKKARVNSKKAGEKYFSNLDSLIDLN